jgi:hypothetical protein
MPSYGCWRRRAGTSAKCCKLENADAGERRQPATKRGRCPARKLSNHPARSGGRFAANQRRCFVDLLKPTDDTKSDRHMLSGAPAKWPMCQSRPCRWYWPPRRRATVSVSEKGTDAASEDVCLIRASASSGHRRSEPKRRTISLSLRINLLRLDPITGDLRMCPAGCAAALGRAPAFLRHQRPKPDRRRNRHYSPPD